MTCPTCRRTDMPNDCGSYDGQACLCCGMIIVAQAEDEEQVAQIEEGTNTPSEE